MASTHKWWDVSWNPVTGCNDDRISAGCLNCYARKMAETRLVGRYGYPADEPFRVTVHPDKFDAPFHWRKPRRIFVCDMGDLFHPAVPIKVHKRVLFTGAMARQHTYLLCTKRPERITETWGETGRYGETMHFGNIHLGTTVEHQDTVDRIGHLLDVPAAVHWIGFEPLLGPVYLGDDFWESGNCVDWIVIGAETGQKRRPCKMKWVESLVAQAKAAQVPVWVKQLAINGRVSYDPSEWPEWARLRELPKAAGGDPDHD